MTSIAGSTIAKARFFIGYDDGAGKNERVSFCNQLEAARSACQREPHQPAGSHLPNSARTGLGTQGVLSV